MYLFIYFFCYDQVTFCFSLTLKKKWRDHYIYQLVTEPYPVKSHVLMWQTHGPNLFSSPTPGRKKKFKPNNNNNSGLFLKMGLWVCLCFMSRGADAVVGVSSIKTWDKREWVWAVGRQSWLEKVQRCSHRVSLLGLWRERESTHSEYLHHLHMT